MNIRWMCAPALLLAGGFAMAAEGEPAAAGDTPVQTAEAPIKKPEAVTDQGGPTAKLPIPLKSGPLLASVTFAGGKTLEKTWIEMKPLGAWVIHEGTRYWYRNADILSVMFLDEEPSDELKASLKKAEDARKAEEARMAEADKAREEGAKEDENNLTVEATNVSRAAEGSSGASSATGDTKAEKKKKREEAKAINDAIGAGNGGGTTGTGPGSDRKGPAAVGSSGGGGGGGGGVGVGPDNIHTALLFQWRVRDVYRKRNEVHLRNRGLKRGITLEVENEEDMSKIKKGQILTGSLNENNMTLTTPNGSKVTFKPVVGQIGVNP